MRVGQRLFLAVLPAVLGVLAMAGLAYWGERGRQVPEGVLLAGLLAATASLGMAWRDTRYVARRIDALSRGRAGEEADAPPGDELDSIERRIVESERRGETRERAAEALVREYAALLADASATAARKLDEVRMPLHILLSSPFGELNENQEEMIAAARAAADEADGALRFVGRIVALDAGRVESRPRPVRPRDLLAPVLTAVGARLRAAGAALEADVPPGLPEVRVDPEHAREALSLFLERAAGRVGPGAELRLSARAGEGFVRIRVEDGAPRPGERAPLAERLLRLEGGALDPGGDALEIRLPTLARGRGANG